MTKNDFILKAMISMAASHHNLHTDTICTTTQVKSIAKAATLLAEAAETVATFDEESNPEKP